MRREVLHGDCLDLLRAYPDASIDAVVTDPPAGIGFLGREWDSDKGGRESWVAWLRSVMAECLRVLKPGGHALVWALPRTSHWTATAVEDAGFDVRDVIVHLFGSGFPKCGDVSKRIPASADTARWQGWSTALKPNSEHWILARKPLDGTVAANVSKHGTGAMNIDGCRTPYADAADYAETLDKVQRVQRCVSSHNSPFLVKKNNAGHNDPTLAGRWPANVTLDEEAAAMLDEQSGIAKPTKGRPITQRDATPGHILSRFKGRTAFHLPADPGGGASRFFYVHKARPGDKTANGTVENKHPTVKNTALMRWLCRLITPPGGTVLDPFAGSGSTGVACVREGFGFVGCEQDAGYVEIARQRIAHAVATEDE
jgi:DNA modification methylase